MSGAREMDPVDQIAEAVEALRLLGRIIFERAGELDQERREVGEILTMSCLIDQQLDRLKAASSRWALAGRAN